MSFALLKKACDGCRESSVKTYWANIKSLARLSGRDDVPFGGSWLSDKLLKRVLSEPINRSKRFTTAGVKAAQMYRVKKPKWIKAMSETTDKYATQRQSGKRTKREAENWPEGGYKALSKLAKELYSEVDLLLNKKQWNTRDLYHFQRYLIVLFYSKHALRGDLADVRIKAPYANNWLKKAGGTYVLHVGRHKTSRAHGAIELRLGGAIKEALDAFLPHVTTLTDHGFLLSTLRGSNKLKRQDMLRLIRNVVSGSAIIPNGSSAAKSPAIAMVPWMPRLTHGVSVASSIQRNRGINEIPTPISTMRACRKFMNPPRLNMLRLCPIPSEPRNEPSVPASLSKYSLIASATRGSTFSQSIALKSNRLFGGVGGMSPNRNGLSSERGPTEPRPSASKPGCMLGGPRSSCNSMSPPILLSPASPCLPSNSSSPWSRASEPW